MTNFNMIMLLLLFSTSFTIWGEDLEQLTMDYNYNVLQKLLENSETLESSYRKEIAYRLFWVLEQTNAPQDKLEQRALQAIEYIEKELTQGEISAENYFRLAHLYNAMISDASSWMKYNSTKDEYLKLSLRLDPTYKKALIFHARILIMFPPNAGGNIAEGFTLLDELRNKYPRDPEILILYAEYFLGNKNYELAKELYREILNIVPGHFKAGKKITELIQIEKNLTIGKITILNKTKTNTDSKLISIKEWEGEIYNWDSISEIREIAHSLPSITGVEIETRELENKIVDLNLTLSENNTKVIGLLGGLSLTNRADESLSVGGFPALLYLDQNFLGSGNTFMMTFGGVFLGLDLTFNHRPQFPFNLNFHIDGLFVPMDYNFNADAVETDWDVKTPFFNSSVTLEKATEIGLLMSTTHNLKMNYFSGGKSGFTGPENNLTYTGNVHLEFSTIENNMPSFFSPPTGFSIFCSPSLIFKPSYEPWGSDGNLYYHDNRPGGLLTTGIEYYRTISNFLNIGGSLTHLGSLNIYESEKWEIGQTNMLSFGPRLSGYYPGEYRSESALIINLNGCVQVIPNTFSLFAKHDLMYEVDRDFFRQGTAIGFAFNFPHQIEFSLETGFAWNAERENGIGWSVQLGLSKYFMR